MNDPKIRFKGYTEAWEQRKLGEYAEIVGGGTPSTNVSAYWDGNINWYAPAEISDQIYLSSSQRKITEQGLNRSSAKMLPVGTVLFTSRAGIGKTAILSHVACTNQGFQSIVPHDGKLDSYFIYSRTEELKKYAETVGAGSTFVEVSGKQMSNMELMMPKTIKEQQVIGNYFRKIDNLITLHQRKCEQTKKLKKYMLQKMFPKNGESVPEIRFSGFTDAWEQRKLNEIAEKVTEKNRNNLYDEPFTNSAEQGIISQKDYFDREVVNEENLDGYYVVRDDDFVYNPRVSVSAPVGPINRNKLGRNGVMSPLYTVFRTHDINTTYLEHYFKTKCWHLFMKMNGDSGARFDRFSIATSLFMEMPIPYPEIDEQTKIGGYFDELDRLITLHQRKCEELNKIKKFMLQNMFV